MRLLGLIAAPLCYPFKCPVTNASAASEVASNAPDSSFEARNSVDGSRTSVWIYGSKCRYWPRLDSGLLRTQIYNLHPLNGLLEHVGRQLHRQGTEAALDEVLIDRRVRMFI